MFEYNFIDVRGIDVDLKVLENNEYVSLDSLSVESMIMTTSVKRLRLTNSSDLSVRYNFKMKKLCCGSIAYQTTEALHTDSDENIQRAGN